MAQQQTPVQTVASVDLDRYVGTWFEIARFPNKFQRKCLGDVRAIYAQRPDGRIDVTNSCRVKSGEVEDAKGVARVVDQDTRARLEVRFAPAVLSFLPMVWGDYWVIGLADDYSWAVVGTPDREYLWVLARTAAMNDDTWQRAIETATNNGFDTARLERTSQGANASATDTAK